MCLLSFLQNLHPSLTRHPTELDMHRDRLVTLRTPPTNITGPIPPASSFPWLREERWEQNDMYNPQSPAYVGKRVEIDGVGGVATLVRADAHR